MADKQVVTIHTDSSLVDLIDTQAAHEHRSRSSMIVWVLRKYFQRKPDGTLGNEVDEGTSHLPDKVPSGNI